MDSNKNNSISSSVSIISCHLPGAGQRASMTGPMTSTGLGLASKSTQAPGAPVPSATTTYGSSSSSSISGVPITTTAPPPAPSIYSIASQVALVSSPGGTADEGVFGGQGQSSDVFLQSSKKGFAEQVAVAAAAAHRDGVLGEQQKGSRSKAAAAADPSAASFGHCSHHREHDEHEATTIPSERSQRLLQAGSNNAITTTSSFPPSSVLPTNCATDDMADEVPPSALTGIPTSRMSTMEGAETAFTKKNQDHSAPVVEHAIGCTTSRSCISNDNLESNVNNARRGPSVTGEEAASTGICAAGVRNGAVRAKNGRRSNDGHGSGHDGVAATPPPAVEATPTDKSFLDALAKVLSHFVMIGVQKDETITRFHAVKAPDITVKDYLERIHRYFGCSNECFVLALVYIDRVVRIHEHFTVSILNIHRLLVTAVMLAAKFFDDVYYSNSFYARVGGVRTREINILEAHFLDLVDYQLFVKADEYEHYRHNIFAAVKAGLVLRAIQTTREEQDSYPSHRSYTSEGRHGGFDPSYNQTELSGAQPTYHRQGQGAAGLAEKCNVVTWGSQESKAERKQLQQQEQPQQKYQLEQQQQQQRLSQQAHANGASSHSDALVGELNSSVAPSSLENGVPSRETDKCRALASARHACYVEPALHSFNVAHAYNLRRGHTMTTTSLRQSGAAVYI